jgi:hypothetical protein
MLPAANAADDVGCMPDLSLALHDRFCWRKLEGDQPRAGDNLVAAPVAKITRDRVNF